MRQASQAAVVISDSSLTQRRNSLAHNRMRSGAVICGVVSLLGHTANENRLCHKFFTAEAEELDELTDQDDHTQTDN